ncbi:MAG: nucleotidyltransferase domain-containing protein [Candidatus Doudnabacteria bacterium]|nr:nucleotidyltransferase domain-containing protein [Candidatus Doudnabacteria bacterium]
MNIEEVKQKTAPIFKQYGVRRAAVFGSIARGTQGPHSDTDLLIELQEPLGLLTFAKLNYTLDDVLKKKLTLLKAATLNPHKKNNILQDLVYIYRQE